MGAQELSWPALPGASEYRVLVRGPDDEFVIDEVLVTTSCRIPALEPPDRHSWQVQWRADGDDSWRPGIPELPLEPERAAEPDRTTILRWEDRGATAYRVLIRDHESDGLLLKLPLLGTSYEVDFSKLPPGGSYRWRLQAWDLGAASWEDLEPYEPLPRPSQTRLTINSEMPTADGPPSVLLLFTVDTEATLQYIADPDPRRAVDEHIFCRHDGRPAGIEMIMDALDRYGFKGTFFLDILGEYQFGKGTLEPVVDAIKRRGHDIQLHLHTAPHLRFATEEPVRKLADAMLSYDADQFRRALELALTLFVERVGEQPVAYRSGAYIICDAYLDVLAEFGLRIDSSLYPFKNCNVSPWMRVRTQPFRVGPLLEVPVSWRLEWRGGGPVPMQFAAWRAGGDNNRSFTQLSAVAGGPPMTLVYLTHSYQYLTRGADIGADEQRRWHRRLDARLLRPEHAGLYNRTDPPWFFGEPDVSRIELLEQNLAELAARGDVTAMTLRTVAEERFDAWDERVLAVDPLPELVDGTGDPHLTATRVYSLDYLRQLA